MSASHTTVIRGYEALGQLITDLSTRCDREGLDLTVRRQADSRGPLHTITVRSWATGEQIEVHSDVLLEALDLILDELNRKELS